MSKEVEKFSLEFEMNLRMRFDDVISNHFEPDHNNGEWKNSFNYNDVIKAMILAYLECYNDNRSGW